MPEPPQPVARAAGTTGTGLRPLGRRAPHGTAADAGRFPRADPGLHREDVLLEPVAGSVRRARALIRDTLAAVPVEQAERAAVCGSELVANAIRHAEPPVVLSIVGVGDEVVVAVTDGSRDPPRPRPVAEDEPGGRGTLIIDRLADRWGVEFLPGGKQVWCTVALGPGGRTGSD